MPVLHIFLKLDLLFGIQSPDRKNYTRVLRAYLHQFLL